LKIAKLDDSYLVMGLHNNMFVIKYKKFFVGLSIFFVAFSLGCIAVFGLKLGIDFKGGSSLELNYPVSRPEVTEIKSALLKAGFGDASVQPAGTNGIVIKSRDLIESERATVVSVASLGGKSQVEQKSFTTVGPSVGSELKKKAIASIILVLIAIILFVAYAFRKVSYPVSSWKYGFVVIIALIHDIIIPTGVFALLGHFYGLEVDTLFIVALLTTLGLSVADTIVVFDRIRENIIAKNNQPFSELVGDSLSQTFGRSINTSLVVLLMVLSLVFFGPASTRLFSIVLAIGMFFGTYSSVFLASPLLVIVDNLQKKQK
jgi:preprotein translocase subunit SecF